MVATDTAESERNDCERLMLAAESDPDLARIVARLVEAGPKLSTMAKRMILAALDASHKGEHSGSATSTGKAVS